MNKSPRTLRNFIFFSTWTLLIHPILSCVTGWFGSKCQFKCHCSGACSGTGACTGHTKCAKGWFGLQCQKQDLLTIANTTITLEPEQTSFSWLTDNDDATCNDDPRLESINVTWFKAYVFTWMRYTVKQDVERNKVRLTFYDANDNALPCSDSQTVKLTKRSFEVHCDVPVGVHKVVVEGEDVRKTCSMHINGGQNFALKIKVSESSTIGDKPTGYRSVDGDVSGDYDQNACTQSKPEDSMPTLIFRFPRSYLFTRFIVYNRDGAHGNRLEKFILEAFNEVDTRVLRYRESCDSMGFQSSYDVLNVGSWKEPISTVEITQTFKSRDDPVPILTVCELESYGDCPPGRWNNECVECVGCYNDTCVWDTGLCILGCNGYRDPPLCKAPCNLGFWGWNCTVPCISRHCLNGSCNKDTGICDRGCAPRYKHYPNCTVACNLGFWGWNCTVPCISSHCLNDSCDIDTGICDIGCAPRYMDYPNCTVACFEHCVNDVCNMDTLECTEGCHEGWYGLQCNEECSKNCLEPGCNTITGECKGGCVAGWFSARCNETCNLGFWDWNCTVPCISSHCLNGSCNQDTGICDIGCVPRYMDYPNCTVACFEHCVNDVCNMDTLECTEGCHEGWYGLQCNEECSKYCQEPRCNNITGDCKGGCVTGWISARCNERSVGEEENPSSGILILLSVAVIVASAFGALGLLVRKHHIAGTTHRPVGDRQE